MKISIANLPRSLGKRVLFFVKHLRIVLTMTLVLFAQWVFAQHTVSGTVTDENGETLPGVNIFLKGTSTGTTTNVDGTYRLEVSDANGTLVFTFIGLEEQEISIGNRSVIDVEMAEGTQQLDEVVITALGFEQKTDETGSSSSIINTSDVSRSGESTLLNGLGAKASNVRISRSNGDPGAGSTIRIRGANSITGNGNPLIIIDGIPISNQTIYGGGNNSTGGRTGGVSQQSRLNDINPNDIESIQILKGASAAALWGSRAANGVVVITTKNGKSGQLSISYKGTASFDQVNQRYEMQDTWGQGRDGVYSPTRAESWGDYIPDRAGGADEVDNSGARFVAANGNTYFPITTKNSRETFVDSNWDEVFQTGGFLQHDLTVSNGNDRSSYFFSLSRLDQSGIIKESDYDRTNVRLNNKVFFTDWLSVSSKTSLTISSSNRIQQSSNTAGLMLGLLRTPPDFDNRDYIGTYIDGDGAEFPLRHRAYRRYLGNAVNPIYNNPSWTINEQSATSDVARYLFSADIIIEPTDFLQFTVRGGFDGFEDKRNYFFPVGSGGSRQNGIFSEDIIGRQEINFDIIGRANFNLTSDITGIATVGWNLNDRSTIRNSSEIVGFLVNARKETTDLNTAAENSTIENDKTFLRSNRGYTTVALNFYDQLFLNLSGAVEASSTVKGNFTYPAADLAWQFTKLPQISTNDIFTFGKLRASWGRVGISAPAHRFQTLAEGGFTYSTYSDPLDIALFGGGFRLDDDKGNPDLEPEIKEEWELGADLRFLRDRLALSFTYYQNNIDGIIIAVDLTPSSGFDTQIKNAAAMENQGFEMDLNYTAVSTGDLTIDFYGNWSTNENKVTDLEGTETIDLSPGASVSSRAIVGQPLGVLYGTGSQKDENGNFILDVNGFPILTTSPIPLGDPNPDWRGGLGMRASWKNIGFNVLVEHSQGGVFSPRSLWVLRRFGTTKETANRMTTSEELVNYAGDVIPSGTTVRGNVANFGGGNVLLDESWYRTGIGGGFGDNQAYNFSIEDATFTRLRELTISYSLNSAAFRNATKLSSVVLSVSGRNLFLWDNIPGVDPEINQTGVGNALGLEYFTNPSTKSWLFSVGVNF